jgi:hypothetical protein
MLNLRPALRPVLQLDAVASGGMGVLLLVLFSPAEDELGLPVALSVTVGVLLLGWAGFVTWVAQKPSRGLVREVIGLNLVYVVLSVVFAFADWVSLTDLGVAFVLVQAAAVVGFVAGQVVGLRSDDLRSDDLRSDDHEAAAA